MLSTQLYFIIRFYVAARVNDSNGFSLSSSSILNLYKGLSPDWRNLKPLPTRAVLGVWSISVQWAGSISLREKETSSYKCRKRERDKMFLLVSFLERLEVGIMTHIGKFMRQQTLKLKLNL